MIKAILKFIVVPVIIIVYGIIAWRTFAPESYVAFWNRYPVVSQTIDELCSTCGLSNKALVATTSEQILSDSGKIIFSKETWPVEIARTEAARTRGLSNVRFLDRQNGLLFVFDDVDYRQFWMKDMLIYLDMIFIDENWKIVLIEENVSPATFPKVFGGEVKSKYVLEINGGEAEAYGLKTGDQLIFLNN